MVFNRKVQKLVSVLTGLATAAFHQAVMARFDDWPQRLALLPHFDARVIQLPTRDEAANMILWRNLDATKNAVSMAAHALFAHGSLHGMSSAAMQERMFQEAGVNFDRYPEAFKRGLFVRRRRVMRGLTEAERIRIPEAVRPASDATYQRSQIEALSVPPLAKVHNRVEFLFDAEAVPIVGPETPP
jgi:tRNA(His) 5'-end guanylyltransferase